mgnify:CR=1 FL=1|tara:strand:+ start:7358 stop:8236 length:879 start_codon:yes stop_codon:yes gene_type:complete
MKILIIGVNGMIGNGMFKYFQKKYNVFGTLRSGYEDYNLNSYKNIYENIDLNNFDVLESLIGVISPDVILNCSGIIKQRSAKFSDEDHYYINSKIPQLISEIANEKNIRLINFSTDCVFDGSKGEYKDDDKPDAKDIYGISKALGELRKKNCLTIRTSSIGLETHHKHGLIEWFLEQNGKTIQGYDNAIYSGLTTDELSRYLDYILINFPDLSGVYNMASRKITKYKLLSILSEKLEYCTIVIEKNTDFICDRSLDGSMLDNITKFQVLDWEKMLSNLAIEINNRAKNDQNF